MGSESLILLCQFESICLSCFRIVIDFLLFSLIFFFFQCFSMTTLTVIIKSAFDLFWLPYYMTFSQHVYFIFTVRKFGFCEIFALWITLISRSSVSQDTISLWTTSSAPMSHCIRGSISENRKNKEVFVTMAQELSLFVIRCWSTSHSQIGLSYACVQTLPTPPPPTSIRKKIGEREVVSLPDSFWGKWERGGASVHRLFDFNFSLSVPVLTVIGKNCELAHFYIHLTSKQRRTFLKVDFKALAKNNPMSDCWQCQNHRT